VTLTLLWEEYCAKCHETSQKPYMSTQFGERYVLQRQLCASSTSREMPCR
jgi:hypothetical protein